MKCLNLFSGKIRKIFQCHPLNCLSSILSVNSYPIYAWWIHLFQRFVCVEVLWPSQPNGVMSSAVSLPNHTLTGQA